MNYEVALCDFIGSWCVVESTNARDWIEIRQVE